MLVSEVRELGEIKSYSSILKNIQFKNSSLQFLPENLLELSLNKNFIFKQKKLKSAYIIDIIHNLILKYYFKKENKFHLMSTILKEKYGYLYNYYIDYLIDNKIIILISNHQKGRNSRIYSLNESLLRGKILRYQNKDKFLIKKYKSKIESLGDDQGQSLIDSDVKNKLVDSLFSVEIQLDRSIFYLDSLKDSDVDIYNRNKYSVECINDKHIFYHFDNYGRLHTNFTILKSFIRKNCLLIEGHDTYELDIKNSQPLFLTKLINDSGSHWIKKNEFELFRNLTINGTYYRYLMEHLDIRDRNKVKEITYKVLFGRNATNSKADKLFSSLFPSIHTFIKLYKKENNNYKILAYELQKAESNLIFNKIIKRISITYPNIKLITVHDSIIFSKLYKDQISIVFNEEISNYFDFK